MNGGVGDRVEIGWRWVGEGNRDGMEKGQNGMELSEIHQQSGI